MPFRKRVTLAEGSQQQVDVETRHVPTATVVLDLATRPSGLAVTLDGAPIDVASAEGPRQIDAGDHVLVAIAPGYAPFRWTRSLADGERADVEVTLRVPLRVLATPKWMFFAASGSALAAIGVAAGIAAHAEGQQSQQLALDPYARDPSVRDSIRSQATSATALFVAGGALGVGAVVLGITTRWRTEQQADARAASITPWVAPGNGGAVVHGHF